VASKPHQWSLRASGDLGRTIADIRRLNNWTQEELANNAGLERTYLAKLEAGQSVLLLDRALRTLKLLGATVTVTWDADREK
jgi:transcriptional regulator with XRE-family HTH domain